jgi:hypothetical protein
MLTPLHPDFKTPYKHRHLADDDAAFFTRRYGRTVIVVQQGSTFWLTYATAEPQTNASNGWRPANSRRHHGQTRALQP